MALAKIALQSTCTHTLLCINCERRAVNTCRLRQNLIKPNCTNTLATKRGTHPGHGSFHPVSWCQYYDGGRSWVTTLGHDAGAFAADTSTFPGAAEFQQHIVAGIKSAMGLVPFCR